MSGTGSGSPPAPPVENGASGNAWLVVLAGALFSTGGAAIKLTELGAPWVAALRSAIAAGLFLAVLPEARRGWTRATWVVGLGYATTMVLFIFANRATTAAATTFLQSAAPLYLLLLGPWILKEPVSRRDVRTVLALALGILLIVFDPSPAQASAPSPGRGNLLATLSGVSWAWTVLGLRWLGRAGRPTGGAVVCGNVIVLMVCFPFLIAGAPGLVADAPGGSVSPGPVDVLAVLWLGLFQIGLAYLVLGRGLRGVSAHRASLLLLAEPALSPLWAWLVNGETPGVLTLVAGVWILTVTTVYARDRGAG